MNMSCFFLCQASDARRNYQTEDSGSSSTSGSGTSGSNATADTSLTSVEDMGVLSTQERAEFASFSRVVACLINEKLVDARFTEKSVTISHANTTDSITVSLSQVPVAPGSVDPTELGTDISYNDIPFRLKGSCMMNIFGCWTGLDVQQFRLELDNSAKNLEAAYHREEKIHRELSIDSPPIDWEQSTVEGHDADPWHKCRYPIVDDFLTATIYFVAVPRRQMEIVGEYDKWIRQLALVKDIDDDCVVLPVHEHQLSNVLSVYPDLRILPKTIMGQPQSDLRTISVASPHFCIKMPLLVKLPSTAETNRPCATTMGHRLEPLLQLIERVAQDFGGSLTIVREFAAAASKNQYVSCSIRESTESIASRTGDRIIVCAALAEHVRAVWGDEFDEVAVFRDFCRNLFKAILPSVLTHGFALQAHMQNLLVRIDGSSREVKGFIVRDLGSLEVHPPTLTQSTSLGIDIAGISTGLDTLDQVYGCILSIVHGDVASMVRALKLGMAGWRVAREELESVIPPGDDLARNLWLETSTFVSKAYISMQLSGAEQECQTTRIPNYFYCCKQDSSSEP